MYTELQFMPCLFRVDGVIWCGPGGDSGLSTAAAAYIVTSTNLTK